MFSNFHHFVSLPLLIFPPPLVSHSTSSFFLPPALSSPTFHLPPLLIQLLTYSPFPPSPHASSLPLALSSLHSSQAVPSLVHLVQNEDVKVKVNACWALSYLAGGPVMLVQVRMQTLRKRKSIRDRGEAGREDKRHMYLCGALQQCY